MNNNEPLNLCEIRNRAFFATDGEVQIAHEMDYACEPSRWLAFVSADHDNAECNAEFLRFAHRDILALLDEVDRLRGEA